MIDKADLPIAPNFEPVIGNIESANYLIVIFQLVRNETNMEL